VVLDERGRAIGWGSNRREQDQQPLGHAELVALQQAARLRQDWRFNGCTLVVTLEPCRNQAALQHPEPVITIPCPSHTSVTHQPARLTWLELLGQR